MISCPTTSVLLLALLASPLLLPRVASSSSASAVDDTKYNGICDVDICTCFTYDDTACPDWMMDRGGSGSFSYDETDDDARQALACYAYSTKFSGASTTDNDGAVVSSKQTESPMNLLNGISLESWIVRLGGENSTVIVNYTASDPAPDCSTLAPPAKWYSSSDPIPTLRRSFVTASGSAIVAVVATFL